MVIFDHFVRVHPRMSFCAHVGLAALVAAEGLVAEDALAVFENRLANLRQKSNDILEALRFKDNK